MTLNWKDFCFFQKYNLCNLAQTQRILVPPLCANMSVPPCFENGLSVATMKREREREAKAWAI